MRLDGRLQVFPDCRLTLAGIELAHQIRKRQFSLGRGRYRNFGSLKQIWERALASYVAGGVLKRANVGLNHFRTPIFSARNATVPFCE